MEDHTGRDQTHMTNGAGAAPARSDATAAAAAEKEKKPRSDGAATTTTTGSASSSQGSGSDPAAPGPASEQSSSADTASAAEPATHRDDNDDDDDTESYVEIDSDTLLSSTLSSPSALSSLTTAAPDYYSLLALPRSPPPTPAQLRAAYRALSLSFHPDKQPAERRAVAAAQFERLRIAYETLADPRKRVVYDLLGEEGVRREWGVGGAMHGRDGEEVGAGEDGKEKGAGGSGEVGVRAMDAGEFRRWFLGVMRRRERRAVEEMVQARGSIQLKLDAQDMFEEDEDGGLMLQVPELRPTSFSVGYNFSVPFSPLSWLRRVWVGDDDEREEKPEVDGEGVPEEDDEVDEDDEPESPLVISASVGGKLQGLKQEITLVDEETGEEFEREVPLPPALIGKNITLGATLRHSIPRGALTAGNTKRAPLSYLEDSNLSLKTLLLPTPLVNASLSRAFQPVSGTAPFHTTVSASFARSPLTTPPVLNVSVQRALGLGPSRHICYANASSGLLFWPDSVARLLRGGRDLGARDAPLVLSTQTSQVEVGYVCTPARRVYFPATDGDGGFLDEEGKRVRTLPFDPRETWGVQLHASPMAIQLSANYARSLFPRPGGMGDDDDDDGGDAPTLAQWTAEGFHPPRAAPDLPDRGAVRIDVSTSVTPDLSLGWLVTASRRISAFSRLGLGLGVQGRAGLVMTFSWHRLGQTIRLPISICSLDLVDADVVALALTVPWALYGAIEFGLLRPRRRAALRRHVARERRRLERVVVRRRADANEAARLMREQVERRQTRERERGGLVVLAAEYGYVPPKPARGVSGWRARMESKVRSGSGRGNKEVMVDVTVPVAALVDQGQLMVPEQVIKWQILGFYDPAPLRHKTLRVRYLFGGHEHYVEVGDGEALMCPMRSHLL